MNIYIYIYIYTSRGAARKSATALSSKGSRELSCIDKSGRITKISVGPWVDGSLAPRISGKKQFGESDD